MESSLKEHHLWKDDGEEDFHWAMEALEKLVKPSEQASGVCSGLDIHELATWWTQLV